ncbi:alpha/beta hydrolase family protein [Sphingomonas aquatica]
MVSVNLRLFAALAVTASSVAWTAPVAAQVKPAADWEGKTVPIEVFGQFPLVAGATLSPDGRWIAAKIRAQGQQVLAILAVGQPGVQPRIIARDSDLSGDKIGQRQVISYRWLNNEVLLIGISSRDNFGGDWFDNVRFASYDRTSQKVLPLGWDKAFAGTSLLWASRDGPPRILLERINPANGTELLGKPEVVEIDAVTGKEQMVMRANPVVSDWSADEAGVVRMGTSFSGDTGRLTVLYRPDAKSGLKTIFSEVMGLNARPSVPDVMLKDGTAYTVSAKDGYEALYEFDLTTMKIGKKVFGVDGYDIDGPLVARDGSSINGVQFTTGRGQQLYFSPRMKEIQAVLEEPFGKGNVRIVSNDAAQTRILFQASVPGQPPATYLFETASGATGRLAWYSDTLKNAMLNPVSTVRYAASDGKPIEAILTMPRHRAGQKNLPLIVLPHGGPWARDDADWDAYGWAQALAEYGYVVIQPNYRGSTGYGTAWTKASEKAWGYRMQDDLNDAVSWLAGQGTIDPKRVCMMGWSYGGYAASRAAQRDGAKYRCAISGAGVHDLPAMVRYDKNYLGTFRAKQALGSAGELVDVSPGLHPRDYSIPILIVHGAKDIRVPVSQSRDLVARLKGAGKVEGRDFVYLEQPLNTHNLLREEDRVQLLQEVKKFLDQHNPA